MDLAHYQVQDMGLKLSIDNRVIIAEKVDFWGAKGIRKPRLEYFVP